MIEFESTQWHERKKKRQELEERGYVSSVWIAGRLHEFKMPETAKRRTLFDDMKKAVKNSESIEAISLDIDGVSKMYYKLQDVQVVINLAADYRSALSKKLTEHRGE